jgi:1-deoxy-D-xylulose-5-phosphate synthase
MLDPVGLVPFAAEFPDRVFDVGIAEQHAATMAAGMAFAGLHPVVAVYATFLNRAFDQVLMDTGLHKAGVTFVLDRAGLTGTDGASHNGQWDLALFRLVPGLCLAAPRDETRLREELREAVAIDDAPTVLRYPKGSVPEDIAALERVGGVDVVARHLVGAAHQVLLVGIGSELGTALRAAELLADAGIGSTVVDPRWVYPVDPALLRLAGGHDVVVTVEDGIVTGGAGEAISRALADHGVFMPVLTCGLPDEFFPHATRQSLAKKAGLTPEAVAARAKAALVVDHAEDRS